MKNITLGLFLILLITFSYFYQEGKNSFDAFNYPISTAQGTTSINKITQEHEVTLIYFGFLSCPEICPTTMSTLASVIQDLPPEVKEKTAFVFIDLDPERDSLEDITYYTNYFHKDIIAASIPYNDLKSFTKKFGIVFKKVPLDSNLDYTIDHSIDIVVLDKNKKFLDVIHHGSPRVVVKNRIIEALK